jgi:molybdopterin converting factor small subunit
MKRRDQMVTVVVSRAWAQHGQTRFEAGAGRLRDIMQELAYAQPDYERRLLDDNGEPYGYLTIFVGSERVLRRDQADLDVADGSTVTIVPPLVGG